MSSRSKSITLKGAAARAFVESLSGTKPKSEQDASERIATRIHMEVHSGNMAGAVALVKLVSQQGIDQTVKALPRG